MIYQLIAIDVLDTRALKLAIYLKVVFNVRADNQVLSKHLLLFKEQESIKAWSSQYVCESVLCIFWNKKVLMVIRLENVIKQSQKNNAMHSRIAR